MADLHLLSRPDAGAPPVRAGDPRSPSGRRRPGRDFTWSRSGYLFLTPWLVGVIGLVLVPLAFSLYLSFTDYNLLSSPEWVGLDNYRQLFGDDDRYLHSLRLTVGYVVLAVPLQLAAALAAALLLAPRRRGQGAYRALFYLPSLLGASVAVSITWRALFDYGGGVTGFLASFGIEERSWVNNPSSVLWVIIALEIWRFGAPMVIFIAGLQQIPAELYEAAALDGAGRLRTFASITVPMLSPIIFFNLVLSMIGSLQTFTQGYVMSNGSGGPANSTLFYNLYLYIRGFNQFDMGYASAMAWLLLIIVAVFTGINFLAQRFWVFYES